VHISSAKESIICYNFFITSLDRLKTVFQKYDVMIAYLFGSKKEKGIEFLRGEPVESEKGSDLDKGVVFEKLPDKT